MLRESIEFAFPEKHYADPKVFETEYNGMVEFFQQAPIVKWPKLNVSLLKLIRLSIYYGIYQCRNGTVREYRTLRNFWYDTVKPFLSRQMPNQIATEGFGRKATQLLSRELSRMVLSGWISYSDLMIRDESRPKYRPVFRFDFGGFDRAVIFIEKESEFQRIVTVGKAFRIAVECGKGFQAGSAIEGLIEYAKEHSDEKILVLAITDYDYFGFLIYHDLKERLSRLGNAEVYRIGVDPEDFQDQEQLADALYVLPKPKSEAEAKWHKKFAINSKFGIEIDALSPEQLRAVIIAALTKLLDFEALVRHRLEEALESTAEDIIHELLKSTKTYAELQRLQEKLDSIEADLRLKYLEKIKNDLRQRDNRSYDLLKVLRNVIKGGQYLADSKYTKFDRDVVNTIVNMYKNYVASI